MDDILLEDVFVLGGDEVRIFVFIFLKKCVCFRNVINMNIELLEV